MIAQGLKGRPFNLFARHECTNWPFERLGRWPAIPWLPSTSWPDAIAWARLFQQMGRWPGGPFCRKGLSLVGPFCRKGLSPQGEPPWVAHPLHVAAWPFFPSRLVAGRGGAAKSCSASRTYRNRGLHPFVSLWRRTLVMVRCVLVPNHRQRIIDVAVLMVIVGLVGFPMVAMTGHPVSLERLSHIHDGSSAEDVLTLLGTPSTVNLSDDGEIWIYSGVTWCFVTIQFSHDRTVIDVDHDH